MAKLHPNTDRKQCESCAKRTSVVGLTAGLFLAGFKLTIGILGRSRALIASGMCNLSDVSSAFVVILGVRYSNKSANRRYQYGFGKLEFIAQVGISGLMILGNLVLIFSSFWVIAHRSIEIPHIVVFFVALISAVVNGLIYKFAKCGARELNSPALKAHADHNKIDVASSLLVAVGVLAARFGLHWADPVIAIFEGIHVIHGSFVIFWDGFKGIMDTSAPDDYVDRVRDVAADVRHVDRVLQIRARQSGPSMLLDLEIELDPELSVLESKVVVVDLKKALRRTDRHIGQIFVQVRPRMELAAVMR